MIQLAEGAGYQLFEAQDFIQHFTADQRHR
jgi:hypothetical protein